MLKKTITYTDYDGNTRTDEFLFNLNKAELTEMELSYNGGLSKMIEKIVNKMLEDMNNIEGKDILTEAVKDKLNKSVSKTDC